jgi:hypothetical protein
MFAISRIADLPKCYINLSYHNLLPQIIPLLGLDGTAGTELFAKISFNAKFSVDFLDGDALIVTAVVRIDEELVPCIRLVLQQKLSVGPIHINLQLVLATHFDAGESGIAVPIPHLHRQPLLRVVHNHGRHLGLHVRLGSLKSTRTICSSRVLSDVLLCRRNAETNCEGKLKVDQLSSAKGHYTFFCEQRFAESSI